MAAKLSIVSIISDESAASLAARQAASGDARGFVQFVITLFASIVAGLRRARIRTRIDDSVGVAATLTITAVQASLIAGDKLCIVLPGLGPIFLTATAGTPAAGDGTFAIITSNTAVATSLKNAINTHAQLRSHVVATSAATLTITARTAGSMGNSIKVLKKVTTAGAFLSVPGTLAGGIDPGALNTVGLTLTIAAAVTADDTLTIGTVVLTAKASPSGENQWAGAVSQAADSAALSACINAHSKLKGIFVATVVTSTGVITIKSMLEGRVNYQTVLAKSMAQGTLSATTFVPPTTDTWSASTVDYSLGAP